jgi:hypothetical protein
LVNPPKTMWISRYVGGLVKPAPISPYGGTVGQRRTQDKIHNTPVRRPAKTELFFIGVMAGP